MSTFTLLLGIRRSLLPGRLRVVGAGRSGAGAVYNRARNLAIGRTLSNFEIIDLPSSGFPDPARLPLTPTLGPLGSLELHHVGVMARDMDRSTAGLGRLLGVQEWVKMRWAAEAVWRGERMAIAGFAAIAAFGPIAIEVTQPTQGRFLMSEWLERHGEGVFHFGFVVDDLPAKLERAAAAGWGIELLSEDEHGPQFAYLDREPTGGVYVELVARQPADPDT